MRSILAILFGLLSVLGCGGRQPAPHSIEHVEHPSEVPLLLPAACIVAFSSDQTVTIRHRRTGITSGPFDQERSFRAIVEQTPELLRVVALAPHGAPAMVLSLNAHGQVSEDMRYEISLPFSSSFILRDIQRAFYPAQVCTTGGELRVSENLGQFGTTRRGQGFTVQYVQVLDTCSWTTAPTVLEVLTDAYTVSIEVHSFERL